MDLRQRDLTWLRESVVQKRISKVTVIGEIAVFLITEGRTDLISHAGTLYGDGLEVFDDRFTFCSQSFQGRLIFPLAAIESLYTRYGCKYEAIHSIYEDEGGQALVVLKDLLLGN
jgi:hypothetical protein